MRAFTFLLSLLTLVLPALLVNAQAPNACSGDCWVHDPAVIRRSDGTYFRFSTGHKIQIATSKGLNGPWKVVGAALPQGSRIQNAGAQDPWAPDIFKWGNTYYLYYSVSQFGSQNSAIGVATSTTMEPGSWRDLGGSGVASRQGAQRYNAIDGNLVNIPGKGLHMSWGSFWDGIFQVKMADPPTKTAGSSYQIAWNATANHAIEAPYIHFRDGWFYLFTSGGACCGLDKNRPRKGDEYRISVCRSQSGTGGYVDRNGRPCTQTGGSIVYKSNGETYAPGHAGVIDDPASGGTFLYFHYINTRRGYADGDKLFGTIKLNWSGGWPSV